MTEDQEFKILRILFENKSAEFSPLELSGIFRKQIDHEVLMRCLSKLIDAGYIPKHRSGIQISEPGITRYLSLRDMRTAQNKNNQEAKTNTVINTGIVIFMAILGLLTLILGWYSYQETKDGKTKDAVIKSQSKTIDSLKIEIKKRR